MDRHEILQSCQRLATHWRLAERHWKRDGNTLAARACAEQAEWCERRVAQLSA